MAAGLYLVAAWGQAAPSAGRACPFQVSPRITVDRREMLHRYCTPPGMISSEGDLPLGLNYATYSPDGSLIAATGASAPFCGATGQPSASDRLRREVRAVFRARCREHRRARGLPPPVRLRSSSQPRLR